MDPNKDIEELQAASYSGAEPDDAASVEDFIRQLEAKEKDLHITADTSIIEIAEAFEEGDLPEDFRQALEKASSSIDPPVEPASQPSDVFVRSLETEIDSLKATIARMESDREEMFKSSQRRAKDFESFKARSERERKETFQNQIGNLATLMLPALDNLHRALAAAEHLPGEKSPAFQQFFEGIVLVNEQISDILVKMGIRPIRAVGEEFDPHFHEAVATEETEEFVTNVICEELLRGYVAGDRVIRHSMVKVAVPSAQQEPSLTDGSERVEEAPVLPEQN
jgi:molecular chaperone GrpE